MPVQTYYPVICAKPSAGLKLPMPTVWWVRINDPTDETKMDKLTGKLSSMGCPFGAKYRHISLYYRKLF